jgi:hypothetical protein
MMRTFVASMFALTTLAPVTALGATPWCEGAHDPALGTNFGRCGDVALAAVQDGAAETPAMAEIIPVAESERQRLGEFRQPLPVGEARGVTGAGIGVNTGFADRVTPMPVYAENLPDEHRTPSATQRAIAGPGSAGTGGAGGGAAGAGAGR